MHQNLFFKVFGFILFCQLFTFEVAAQVKYAFVRDTIEIKGGETFANMLKVSNGYSQKVVLKNTEKGIKGMLSLPDSLVLAGGETKTFPVKYIADRQTIKSNVQAFSVRLVSVAGGLDIQQSAAFMTQLSDVSGLTIGTEDNEIYLSQLSNQAQVMVRVANNGFVPVTFRLLLSGIPDGLEFTGQTMSLTLQPGAQQLLPFLARNKTGARNSSDYTVTIRALDGGNNELALKILRIVSVTSARRMGLNNDQYGSGLPNTIALRYVSNDKNSSFYQLQSTGLVKTGKQSTLEYNLNADQYVQRDVKGTNIYNTYVDYQAKKWGVKVGNLYENLDYSLSGAGVKASLKFKENEILSFYGVETNYQLVSQFKNVIPGAKIFALDYYIKQPKEGDRRLTLLHGHDPFRSVDVNQLSMKSDFKLGGGQTLGFEGGYSLEDLYAQEDSPKQGYAGGLNYLAEGSQYQFYGTGYYSSPYFTGLRRGLLQADARLVRNLSKNSNLSARASLLSSNPKYQYQVSEIYNPAVNKNQMLTYELGYNTRVGNFYLGLTPYYLEQHLVSNTYLTIPPTTVDWRSSSMRFATNFSYNGRNKSVSLTADYGYTYMNTSGIPPAPFHSLKINANYSMPIIGFNSYIQINPFYLTDALSLTTTSAKYQLYSLGPNIHFSGLKNRLNFEIGGMFNYYGFTKITNYTATGNLRYIMKGHWTITGDLQYTQTKQMILNALVDPVAANQSYQTNSLSYNNRQIRVGIEKQFGGRGDAALKKMELTYYEDHNNNGLRDQNEPVVAGVLVKINGEAALTNSKGTVEFNNMKKEVYTVAVTNTKGWSLQEPTVVLLNKNKKIEVPLVRTQALNGHLKIIASKYLDGKPTLSGIRVNAVDGNGQIHQTFTDDQGAFCFYLPRNDYTVYIETEGMPFSIENGKEQVSLTGLPVDRLTFIYKDERRKVGVTHF